MKIISTPKWDKVRENGFVEESEVLEALHEKRYNINKELFDTTRNLFLLSGSYLVAEQTGSIILHILSFVLFLSFLNKLVVDIQYSLPDHTYNNLLKNRPSFKIIGFTVDLPYLAYLIILMWLNLLFAQWILGLVDTINDSRQETDKTSTPVVQTQELSKDTSIVKRLNLLEPLTFKQILEFETQDIN